MSHRCIVVEEAVFNKLVSPNLKRQENKEERQEAANEAGPRLVEEIIPEHRWLSALPPSFRSKGRKLLVQLQEAGGFAISNTGQISINNTAVEDYDIGTLLRTLVIPFHRGQLPQQIEEWLRSKNMTKFRNHLIKIRPRWEPLYNLRASTMDAHQEH